MSKSNPPVLAVVNSAKKSTAKNPGNTGGNGGSGSSKSLKFGDYVIKAGAFHQIKAVRAGPEGDGFVEFPLCNFTWRLSENSV